MAIQSRPIKQRGGTQGIRTSTTRPLSTPISYQGQRPHLTYPNLTFFSRIVWVWPLSLITYESGLAVVRSTKQQQSQWRKERPRSSRSAVRRHPLRNARRASPKGRRSTKAALPPRPRPGGGEGLAPAEVSQGDAAILH